MQYELYTEDNGLVASLDMGQPTDLTTYLNNQTNLDISSLFPQAVDQPTSWSVEGTRNLLAQANDALVQRAAQAPAPETITEPTVEVSKAEADLTPEEHALLEHIPHTSSTQDGHAWVTFMQPGATHLQQIAHDQALAQAQKNLAWVTDFFESGATVTPQPMLILRAAAPQA